MSAPACETWVCLYSEHPILTVIVAILVCSAVESVASSFANAWIVRGRNKQ